MKRNVHRLVAILAGTLGLTVATVATATPALAGFNHTEPFSVARKRATDRRAGRH